ncbi:unnamed protein product [Heterobilharzia americana]|nr:unnamed protein product [Heterobilharzia americana]
MSIVRQSLDSSARESSVIHDNETCLVEINKYENDEFFKKSFALLFENTIQTNKDDQCKMYNILRKTPIDMLSLEWLNSEPRTIETRVYLINNLLPQVILGLEFILKEAYHRGLITNDILDETNYHVGLDRNFNPINRLAEYLMRNNHKYDHFNELSPYVRGLRNTVAKLQNEIFMRSENQLAQLKLTSNTKRIEEKQKTIQINEENNRRMKIISSIYDSFTSTKKNSVDAKVMHDVIYTFSEVILKLPEEMKKCLVPIFETQIMDDSGTFYDREQFVKYLMIYARSMSTDVFDQLMEHLKLCAVEFWKAEERHERRKLLKKCFISCDLDQLNEINRDKVFHLCEMYFDTCEQTIKQMIHYPRDWVTREYHLGLSLKESSPRKESMKWQSSAKSENNNQRKTEQILSSEKINDSTVEVFEKISKKSNQIGSRQLDDLNINSVKCKQKDKLIKVDQIIETNGLTQHQFISIMEFLIPETVPLNILQQCLMVLRKYTETTEEHDERKLKHFQRNIKLKKDLLMKKIFYTMNRECSGMLNLRKFENYLLDYEDGFYEAHLKQDLFSILQLTASRHLSRQSTLQTDQTTTTTTSTVTCSTIPSFEQISVHSDLDHSNAQLSSLYHYYPEKTVEISLNHFKILLDDIFWPKSDEYLNYLNKKLVENMSNKIRCEIRREWIQKIINAAQNSYSNSMELVYKSIFQILVKDTLKHGGQKQIGVKIAILCPTINENMLSSSIDTQYCLQYVAAIPDSDAESVLGKSPEKQKSDLLTQCLRTGSTLVHCEMSNIKKFSNLNKESQNTSVYNDTEFNVNHQSVPFALAIPIPNTKKYFIGLMEVNNFSDSGQQPKFEEHEIQFYRFSHSI